MKNKIIILTVFAGLLLSACSDYLDRKPYTQPSAFAMRIILPSPSPFLFRL